MFDGIINFKDVENKSLDSETSYKECPKDIAKLNELFADDFVDYKGKTVNIELQETNEPNDTKEEKGENSLPDFKEIFEMLFSEDFIDNFKQLGETNETDSQESNIEKSDPVLEKIEKSLTTPEGMKELIEKHPEKADLWKSQMEALEVLNDPEASPAEIRSSQNKLSILKGQLMEVAVKDALSEAGFDVEQQQRVVEGESGGTRPDVIAKNNTDHPIEVFGVTIQPGETLCIECKCGGSSYMKDQLNNHIPNQLSGHEGTKILLTTSDINNGCSELAAEVCEKYDAKLVTTHMSVSDVEKAIKEVAKE